MPQKTRARKNARRVGQSATAGRKKGQPPVCRSGPEKAPAAAIIADSLHSLKLAPIPTPDFARKMHDAFPDFQTHNGYIKYEAVLKDVWLCYRAAMWKFHKRKLSISESGLLQDSTLGEALRDLLQRFERDIMPCFPEGSCYNIDGDYRQNGYCISVYNVCGWNSALAGLELKRIIKHLLKNRHYALHSLFLSFIRTFWGATGAGSFWGGTMEMSEEWLESKIEQAIADCPDPTDRDGFRQQQKWIGEMQKSLFSYRYGEAAKYANKIMAAPLLTSVEFRTKLKRIRRDHPIKRLIEAGCHYLLDAPFCIQDFTYGYEVHDDAEGLGFEMQTLITWEWDDPWTVEHTDYIDSIVNDASSMDPVASYRIDWRNKEWMSLERYCDSLGWPQALYNFFDLANMIVKPIYNESTHRIRVR